MKLKIFDNQNNEIFSLVTQQEYSDLAFIQDLLKFLGDYTKEIPLKE